MIAKVGFSLTAVAHGRVQNRSQPDDGGQSICVRKVRDMSFNGLLVRVFYFSSTRTSVRLISSIWSI